MKVQLVNKRGGINPASIFNGVILALIIYAIIGLIYLISDIKIIL